MKKIGIWGLGKVGKSVIQFFSGKSCLSLLESKELSDVEHSFCKLHNVRVIRQKNENVKIFLNDNDFILASPGIDLELYSNYKHKFITELDLFAKYFKKSTIAITGSLGKTTITYLLHQLLNPGTTALGGNIGIPMLDILQQKNKYAQAILELSSFQLEQCKQFAPNLAIWTNLYPNHLDRHKTLSNYFDAKYKILEFQHEKQQALLPLALFAEIVKKKPQAQLSFFSLSKPKAPIQNFPEYTYYWLDDSGIMKHYNNQDNCILLRPSIPQTGFVLNWLICAAALDCLNKEIELHNINFDSPLLHHRLEYCGAHNGIDFYNDSKSTVMESTIAAVEQLKSKPIILLLGGLSKGINREPYFKHIAGNVKELICFGKEAEQLSFFAQKNDIKNACFNDLEKAFEYAVNNAQEGDQILLSPAGSSFDLYDNYTQRGDHFKQLVCGITNP